MKNKKLISLLLLFSVVITLICFSACGEGKNAPTALPFPQIELTGNVISWNEVENAENYEIYENGEKVAAQSETSYTVTKTAKGTYKFKIKAIDADGVYSASEFSNEVTYTVETDKLSAPKISKQDNIISWTAVQHADGYEVYEDGELVSSQSETSFTIQKTEAGTYKYAVKATSTNADYSASELSNEVTHIISEQLAAPQISIEGKVISWQAVAHAETYVIYENGVVLYQSWTRTSYEIEQTIVGEYTYFVVARSSDPAFKMSANSNTLGYEVLPKPIETPDGLAVENGQLAWAEKEGAATYEIYEDGIIVAKQAHSPYQIPLDHEPGTVEFTVKAFPAKNDRQYLESEVSEPLSHTITDDRTPLETPQNLHMITRQEEKNPGSGDGEMVEKKYLVWDPVEFAGGYFVYESGVRVVQTGGTEIELNEAIGKNYKYAVQAMPGDAGHSAGERSEEFEGYTVEKRDMQYTVTLDMSHADGFAAGVVEIALMQIGPDGLPMQPTGQVLKIGAGSGNIKGVVTFGNDKTFIAKANNLPAGYYATEIKLNAEAPEGVIAIYESKSSKLVQPNVGVTVTATGGDQGNTGTENEYLFVAPEKGEYKITTENGPIILARGGERTTFIADANEAVPITVNPQRAGQSKFTITKVTKKYVEMGEMTGETPSGGSNAIYDDGQLATTFYIRASSQPKRYMIMFTTATMSNTRFVTLTINGKSYDFDGGYCTTQNVLIPAGTTDTEIRARISGTAVDTNLGACFYVIPLN